VDRGDRQTRRAPPAKNTPQASLGRKDRLVYRVRLEIKDWWDHKAQRGRLDSRVHRDCRDRKACRDHKVFLGLWDQLGLQAHRL
jgi:hypothetical protein